MESKRKTSHIFIKIMTLTIVLHVVFFLGISFQKWGGFDRLLPETIDYLRNNVFGDEFVLYMEKKFFNIKDTVSRTLQSNNDNGTGIAVKIDKPININLKNIIIEYQSDYRALNNDDYKYLSMLMKGFTPDLTSVFKLPLKNEGVWEKFNISPTTLKPYYAKTFVRTDRLRKNSYVVLYKFDLDRLNLDFIPGKKDLSGDVCSGAMNKEQEQKVKWIFNGGYQYRHGRFGMKYNGKILLPPKIGAMTVFFYKDGSIKIAPWTKDTVDDPNIVSFRQNEKPLIVDGRIDPNIDRETWGWTPKDWDPIYTVRTGMGLTANNELVFAFGPNLSAKTLAMGMLEAGVVNGMHLDMNYLNTHLVRIERDKNGKLKEINEHRVLSCYENIYIKSHPRDYFILMQK